METLKKAHSKLDLDEFRDRLKELADDDDLIGFDEFSIVVVGKEVALKSQTKLEV